MTKFLKEITGFAFIFSSIELFDNPDFFTWQTIAQIIMVVIGVQIITTQNKKS